MKLLLIFVAVVYPIAAIQPTQLPTIDNWVVTYEDEWVTIKMKDTDLDHLEQRYYLFNLEY